MEAEHDLVKLKPLLSDFAFAHQNSPTKPTSLLKQHSPLSLTSPSNKLTNEQPTQSKQESQLPFIVKKNARPSEKEERKKERKKDGVCIFYLHLYLYLAMALCFVYLYSGYAYLIFGFP